MKDEGLECDVVFEHLPSMLRNLGLIFNTAINK